MIIFKTKSDLKKIILKEINGISLGFVPTMGALHEGHLSLIQVAKTKNSHVVVSIFVNPTQFNDPKDFEKYPKTLENDINMLEKAGCDYLFLPEINEIYTDGTLSLTHYELGEIEKKLEGVYRPGHFQGVCNIVDRLFELIGPDDVYFGQKDYQQCLVIKKMMHIRGYQFNFHVCPTIRESDGLAMSSRNLRLTVEERSKASGIFRILSEAKNKIGKGYVAALKKELIQKLNSLGFRTDYLEFSDPETLEPIEIWNGKNPYVILVAAYLGDIRLIDNLVVIHPN